VLGPVITLTALTAWLLIATTHATQAADQIELVKTALAVGGGTGGVITLILASRRQWHTEQDSTAQRITELYTKAADQLGSDKAPVRLAGLYALERVAQDNPGQRQTIINVLCAYLRMPYTPPTDHAPANNAFEPEQAARTQEQQVRLTAQRILATHLRAGPDPDHPATTFWPDIDLDLTGATLIDFDLTYCKLRSARFGRAQFIGKAWFGAARFAGDAWFSRARFAGIAWFREARFAGSAGFVGAQFAGSTLFDGAQFDKDAGFSEARFAGATQFDNAVKFDMGGCWVRTDVPHTVTDDRVWPAGLEVVDTAEQPSPSAEGTWGRLIENGRPDPS
jgi:hypothetical protein